MPGINRDVFVKRAIEVDPMLGDQEFRWEDYVQMIVVVEHFDFRFPPTKK